MKLPRVLARREIAHRRVTTIKVIESLDVGEDVTLDVLSGFVNGAVYVRDFHRMPEFSIGALSQQGLTPDMN